MFEVGDKVYLNVYNTNAVLIKDLGEIGNKGSHIFEVETDSGDIKRISSTFMKKISNPQKSNISRKEKINNELANIMIELNLQSTSDQVIQLQNCCKLQKYIVENFAISNNNNIQQTNEDELYNILTKHKGNSLTNSIFFKEIISKLGADVRIIEFNNIEKNEKHYSNIVKLKEKYFVFDTNLEQEIYKSFGDNKEVILCAAGLGTELYGRYYTPLNELTGPRSVKLPVPNNISNHNISKDTIRYLTERKEKNRKTY